jgi:hypothetical protein
MSKRSFRRVSSEKPSYPAGRRALLAGALLACVGSFFGGCMPVPRAALDRARATQQVVRRDAGAAVRVVDSPDASGVWEVVD